MKSVSLYIAHSRAYTSVKNVFTHLYLAYILSIHVVRLAILYSAVSLLFITNFITYLSSFVGH